MSNPTDKKPLREQVAGKLRELHDRAEREMREAIEDAERESNPRTQTRYTFDPASVRILRRTIPTTTPEICADVLDRLTRDSRVTLYGKQLKFRSASAPTATPIDSVAKLRTLIHVVLERTCTDDLCSEILKMTKE